VKFLSGAVIDPEVFGSVLLLPGKDGDGEQGFDSGSAASSIHIEPRFRK
jgi:hypothetical protein